MPYPSTLSTFTDPLPTQRLNAPSHSSIESAQNTGLEEVQTFVGTLSSAVGTLVYDVRAAASGGGGHVQVANKGGTGQTSYNKGDILVAQSSSVLSKLAVSATQGHALVVDSSQDAGVKWGVPNFQPTVRIYNAASTLTWVKPSTLAYIDIEMVGGGGGGATATNLQNGGGGGGAYARGIVPASLLGANVTVVIGSGASNSVVGGATHFGSILVAGGGLPGSGATGGAGGSVSGTYSSSVFTISTFTGGTGRTDTNSTPDAGVSGAGGGNVYGRGGAPAAADAAAASGQMDGENGTGHGAGGSGAIHDKTPGNGAVGLVIIREY